MTEVWLTILTIAATLISALFAVILQLTRRELDRLWTAHGEQNTDISAIGAKNTEIDRNFAVLSQRFDDHVKNHG